MRITQTFHNMLICTYTESSFNKFFVNIQSQNESRVGGGFKWPKAVYPRDPGALERLEFSFPPQCWCLSRHPEHLGSWGGWCPSRRMALSTRVSQRKQIKRKAPEAFSSASSNNGSLTFVWSRVEIYWFIWTVYSLFIDEQKSPGEMLVRIKVESLTRITYWLQQR